MKTTSVALVLCLNIGVDPPDVIKISPCARLECWLDPSSMQPQKALDAIGKMLQAQYERWQPRARYRMVLDPTVDDVKKLCVGCRRNAKNERVLYHYNGHGVPKPTVNGEIWVFNKGYTQYIPLSIYDLQSWVGNPCIYVFDCSAAGLVVNAFQNFAEQRLKELQGAAISIPSHPPGVLKGTVRPEAMQDCILLAACSANETLPQSAELPADVFSSCLTTPISMALRWFCGRSLLKDHGLSLDLIDKIPGRQTDRKTPLGELNWIFTAVTDTIAWNTLPRELFQKLFRQDLLVASLFRNFLLAERIMKAANCTPISYPALPSTHQHPMWDAWDLAAEMCLAQLPRLLSGDPGIEFTPSPFFAQQLTAFEVWLENGTEHHSPPEQLPIVLQVLLSQSHRLKALILLSDFLDLGPWAVDLALSVGIFPYVLKLLQTTAAELRDVLVFIWTKILALDRTCQVDLVKDGGHIYFIKYLDSANCDHLHRAMSAFVLAAICDAHPKGTLACLQAGLLPMCISFLKSAAAEGPSLLLQWLVLLLAKLWEGSPDIAAAAILQHKVVEILAPFLMHASPDVRAAAAYAMGGLIRVDDSTGFRDNDGETVDMNIPVNDQSFVMDEKTRFAHERSIILHLLHALQDGSPCVRLEIAVALARIAAAHNLLYGAAYQARMKSILRQENGSSVRDGSMRRESLFPTLSSSSLKSMESNNSSQPEVAGSPNGGRKSGFWPAVLDMAPCVKESAPGGTFEAVYPDSESSVGHYASMDAALVGSGFYHHLVDATVALAHDPSPKVGDVAEGTLKTMAGFYPINAPVSTNSRHNRTNSWSFSWKGGSSYPRSASPSSGSSALMRRHVEGKSQLHDTKSCVSIAGDLVTGTKKDGDASSDQKSSSLRLPRSQIYEQSRRQFSHPSKSEGSGLPLVPSSLQKDVWKWVERRHEASEQLVKLNARESVANFGAQTLQVDTESIDGIADICFQPLSRLIVSGDLTGTIRVHDFQEGSCLNKFRVAPLQQAQPGQVDLQTHRIFLGKSVYSGAVGLILIDILNDLEKPALLTCARDGVVRIWRDFLEPGHQVLASAWQALPRIGESYTTQMVKVGLQLAVQRTPPAVFSWVEREGHLLCGGGGTPSIYIWDVQNELCCAKLNVPRRSDGSLPRLTCLSGLENSPLVLAGCDDGTILKYDTRQQNTPVAGTRVHRAAVVQVLPEPGGLSGRQISGSVRGDLAISDDRSDTVLRRVQAHKGSMSALCKHRGLPIVATGDRSQLVRIWSADGEQIAAVRSHSSFLTNRVGPVTALRFHPFQPLLASASTDAHLAIYSGL